MTKIAIHQMCSGIDAVTNAQNMAESVKKAAEAGASFYFAPEMSVLLDRNRERAAASIKAERDSEALTILREAARSNAIWLHIGSMPVLTKKDSAKFANRTLLIDDKGEVVARYDKMHLFDVNLATGESWRESSAYVAGESPAIATTPLGLMGLTICYDMRFPALYAELGRQEAAAIAVPAAFTVPTGKAHWHPLLRARAIEAEAFVIAAAQSGGHEDGRQTYGHSLVIDPWGEVLLDMGEGEGLGFAELDLGRIAEVRAQIPVHANRRDIGPAVRMP